MPVKIRLTRMGKKKQPSYRVVVMDSRKPRDGAYIEQIGRYDPLQDPSLVEIDAERALYWLNNGAQPTERARKLLEISGAWGRYRVARGEIHTIEPVGEPEVAVTSDAATESVGEPEGAATPDAAAGEERVADEPASEAAVGDTAGQTDSDSEEAT